MISPLYKAWLALRSALFWSLLIPSIIIAATIVSLSFWTPLRFRTLLLKGWVALTLWTLEIFCGLGYEVEGLENIPQNGFIIMCKHSSTWETIVLQQFFGPMVWVVKRELTWIPFFGWALKSINSIALNRGTGRKAINQLVTESRQRMDEGRILVMFPEGTRVLPMQYKPFKIGGAIVSQQTGYAVLPIAHNAGEFWPRHSWIKWPGTIKVVIGKPIDPKGKTPEQIIGEVEKWITSECQRISDHAQLQRLGIL